MKDGCKKRNLGNPNATWHLHQIAVLPECQGKGKQIILCDLMQTPLLITGLKVI